MSGGSRAAREIDPVSDEGCGADADPSLGISIEVVHEAGAWDDLAGVCELAQSAAYALTIEMSGDLEDSQTTAHGLACVALSNDEAVALLNTTYRGKQNPTNVLSFPAGPHAREPGELARFLGDIVLAQETVAHEAAERGVLVIHHLQHLIVHGLLHLLGYDHETEVEARVMEAIEVRTLSRLGIQDPYAAEQSEAP